MIYQPPFEQSDWSDCYNHGRIYYMIGTVYTRTHDCMVLKIHSMIHVHMNVKDPLSQDNVV